MDKEEKHLRRDRIIHKGLMLLMVLMACAFAYLVYEITNPQPAPAPEEDLSSPTFFIPPDNTKELNLEMAP